MKLKEKKFRGLFWLPDDRKNSIAGSLSIDELGGVSTELTGEDHTRIGGSIWSSSPPLLHGEVEHLGSISLLYSHAPHVTHCLNDLILVTLHYRYLLTNTHVSKKTETLFDRLTINIEGLNRWADQQPFRMGYAINEGRLEVTYNGPKSETKIANENLEFGFTHATTFPHENLSKSALIVSHEAALQLKIKNKINREDTQTLVDQVYLLVQLFMGQSAELTALECSNNDVTANYGGQEAPIKNVTNAHFYPFKKTKTPFDKDKIIFYHVELGDRFLVALDKWIKLFPKIESAARLFLASYAGIYHFREAKFLALAQALETLHRETRGSKTRYDKDVYGDFINELKAICPDNFQALLNEKMSHANEPTYHQRLEELFAVFKSDFHEEGLGSIITNIKIARNYLTHYPSSMKQRYNRIALRPLIKTMETCFILNTFQLLGIDTEDTKKQLRRGKKYENVIKRQTEAINYEKETNQPKNGN